MIRPRCTQAPTGAAAEAARMHRAAVPVIETARLTLRAPRIEDLALWTEIFTGPLSAGIGGPYTPEDAWTEFSYYTAGWMLHGHGLWSVERRADDVLLGFVHLGLEWDDDEPELGYLFGAHAHGQGYATEAAAAARDHGFTLLDSFVSYVDPANAASNRLAEALGATRDAGAEDAIRKAEGDAPHVWRHRRAR